MSSSTQTCDPIRLEHFLLGDLNGEAERKLTAHLDECLDCRDHLECMAADPTSWNEAEVLLKGQEFDQADTSAGQALQPLQIQQVLESLAPTDDPKMLGRLGNHEISGFVGVGAMGVVLKALDRSLDRVVAIKVLAPHLATSGAARKRFAREAKAAAAVLHPNVMAIHSVSNDESLPFLVMPYVRGASLQRRLDDEGPLPVSEILRIGSQIAAGLAAAHGQGLVHRDIKPANILLEEGVERVAITDFGLARAVDDATMTRTGFIAGTPQYMSPEQARGESVDQRSDLFSLGSVMYTMCAGRAPFRAETSYGVMRRITDAEARPIREINPEIPEWLCGIIDRLMSKQAGDRFECAGEVAELLEECLAHVQQPTVVSLPDPLVTRTRERHLPSFLSRSSGVIAMFATVCLAVLGLVFLQGTEPFGIQPSQPEKSQAASDSKPSALGQQSSKKPTVDRKNARSVIEAYVAAALAEETASAMVLAKNSPATPRQIEAFSENLNVKRLAIKWVYVSDKSRPAAALAVSEKVKLSDPQPDGQADGLMVFELARTDGAWYVVDIDFESNDGADEELKRFLTRRPDSIVLPPKANKSPAASDSKPSALDQESSNKPVSITFHLGQFEPNEELTEFTVVGSDRTVFVVKKPFATSLDVAAAQVIDDARGQPAIEITFKPASAKRLGDVTARHLDKPVAIIADGKLLMAPTIRNRFGSKALIAGRFSREEAVRIASGVTRHLSLLDASVEIEVSDKLAEPVWGEPLNGLQLALCGISNDRHFKTGSTIRFKIRVRNVGSKTIRFQYHIPKTCDWTSPLVETADGEPVRMNPMSFRGGHKTYVETLEPNDAAFIHIKGILVLGTTQTAYKWWPRIEQPDQGEFKLTAFTPPIYLIDSNGKQIGKPLSLASGAVNVHFDKPDDEDSNDVKEPE